MKRILILTAIVLLMAACKATKTSTARLNELPAKTLIKRNEKAAFKQKTVKASLSVKYKGKNEMPNISAQLRMVRDSALWINFSKLGFPIAKAMITQDSVLFYEKISKTYFKGDFSLISQWLGTDFDYNKVQSLFWGEPLLELKAKRMKASVDGQVYKLSPKAQDPLFNIFYYLDPQHFKIRKETIQSPKSTQNLSIEYKDFQKINESLFPKGFYILAKDQKQRTEIEVNYRNIQTDVPLRFPFQIPSGYEKIVLK